MKSEQLSAPYYTWNTMAFGCNRTTPIPVTLPYYGRISEVWIIDGTINSTQIGNVEAYLLEKYK